jgi:hypothetical protein
VGWVMFIRERLRVECRTKTAGQKWAEEGPCTWCLRLCE